jgi:hypothetical protein
MAARTVEKRLDETRRIYRWRLRELLGAGYDRRDARVLASDFSIDLHLAVELPRRGCPPATAVRILL